MLLNPSIIALLLSSALISILMLYAGWYGLLIIRGWDIASGSSRQLELERRTCLLATIIDYVLAFQLCSLFLYVFTADRLSSLFTGAMCAAGTLNVNGYGYPVLILKIINFLLAGLWLILNRADMQAETYPLVRKKYGLMLLMLPLILAESICQASYFSRLEPDVITSCCGSLFSDTGQNAASDIAALPVLPTAVSWYFSQAAMLLCGGYFYLRAKGGYLFALCSAVVFITTMAAVLSFISVYIYELPTHHCPFCMLQKEYGYIGYFLYAALFGSTVTGIGVGILMPFRRISSLAKTLPVFQQKLCLASVILTCVVLMLATCRVFVSNMRLFL